MLFQLSKKRASLIVSGFVYDSDAIVLSLFTILCEASLVMVQAGATPHFLRAPQKTGHSGIGFVTKNKYDIAPMNAIPAPASKAGTNDHVCAI